MKKIFIYLITAIILSFSVYAYSVSITWNFDQSNYDFEAYRCANAACSAVTGAPILTGNSGASTSVTTTYSATGTNRTAFYFFADSTDDNFRAKGFIVTTSGAINTSVNDTFDKKNSCQANVTDINTIPAVLDSGSNSVINVTVNSPFRVSDSAPGSPLFRPAARSTFFGADTRVNVTVTNSAGTILFSGSQNVTLAEDEVRNVSFNWNNMPLGDVSITADTQVIDSQCNLTNALAHSRVENFTVLDLNNLPVANAGPDRTVGVNRTVTFDGSSSTDSDGFITNYFWDFGDNTNATGQIVTHNFTTRANFTVTLTVTDNNGATDNDTAFVQVDGIPTAVISGPSTGFTNQALTFNAGQSSDDGNITSYAWSFGDGGTATGSIVTHTYLSAGTFTVILTVTDNNNLTDTDTFTVTITDQTSSGGQSSSSRRGGSSRSRDRHEVRITDVIMDKTLICGVPSKVQLQLSNTGDFDERRMRVSVENSELDVKEFSSVDLEENGRRIVDFELRLGENARPGDYNLNLIASFGRGQDFITQGVSVECGQVSQEFVSGPSLTESQAVVEQKETTSKALVVTSIILVIIVVILVLVWLFR